MAKTAKHGGAPAETAVAKPSGDGRSYPAAAVVPGDQSVNGGLAVGGALSVTGTVTAFGYLAVGANAGVVGTLTVGNGVVVTAGLGALVTSILASDTAPKNANTTLADSGLAVALEAGGVYDVNGVVIYSASTTADLKLGWSGLTTPTFHWTAGALTSGAAAASASINLGNDEATDSQVCGGVGAGTKVVACPRGILTVGAAGTLKLQYAQGTSDASDALIYAGSVLTFRRIA